MKAFKFIQKTYCEDGDNPYLAILSDLVGEMKLSDTYDNYGQKVTPDCVGDSIELRSELALKIVSDICKELDIEFLYTIDSVINAFDNIELYNNIIESNYLTEDIDYVGYYLTCEGFNYWDGSNYKSVIIKSDLDNTDYELIDDEELEITLNKAINDCIQVKTSNGLTFYESDEFILISSAYASSFESYSIYLKSDYEDYLLN